MKKSLLVALPLLVLFAVGIIGPDFIAWRYWRLFDQALAAAFVGLAALLVYLVVHAQQRAEADAVAAVPGDALVLMRGRASCDLDGGYLIVTSDRLLFSAHGSPRKAAAVRRWALRDLEAMSTASSFGLWSNVLRLRFRDAEIRLTLPQRDRWRETIAAAAARAGARVRVDGTAA